MKQTSNKQQVIEQYRIHGKDTGSVELQIALLTNRITQINQHLSSFAKDYSSRRGLMKLVGHRRSLLAYLKNKDEAKYSEIIGRLGIRG